MSLIGALKGKGPNGFGYASTAEEVTAGIDLTGQTILVTGCNSGLGLETVRALGLRGARVLATARTIDKAQAAVAGLPGTVVPLACELSEPASVRACVDAVKRLAGSLDVILCNAGVMAIPTLQQAHGCELHFFTNHIGHFILVNGLLERLAPAGRVVVVASNAHRRAPANGLDLDDLSGQRGSYQPMRAYGQSKLANILFTRELARRLGTPDPTAARRQTANTLHPGVIATNITRTIPSFAQLAMRLLAPVALKTTAQGAATQSYLATNPAVANVTGAYYADCNPAETTAIARDMALAARLWEVSEQIAARV